MATPTMEGYNDGLKAAASTDEDSMGVQRVLSPETAKQVRQCGKAYCKHCNDSGRP